MILALTASLAIVVADHSSLRAAPQSNATELTTLWQGDVLEVRGERAGYLKVYDYRRERGGFLRTDALRAVELTESGAPELLAVLRFLSAGSGSESLGISYGAAYLRAVPPAALTAEPFDAIARMAERLADQASSNTNHRAEVAAHLEVVQQFGIRMHTLERNGRMQVCYDGDLFRRVLAMPSASSEERAHAALGLTRPDCIDPDLSPALLASLDAARSELLEGINDRDLSPMTRSRVHARRAAVWAAMAFEQARRSEPSKSAAERALAELLAVQVNDLGDDTWIERDAALRVGGIRWGTAMPLPQVGPLILDTQPGEPGQTCLELHDARRSGAGRLARRCTYGIVWTASIEAIPQGPALVLAVQPLESWRELWIFHEQSGTWRIDVISPGADDPEEGYVEFAGYVPSTKRVLIAREVKERGRFRRRFEELRLEDLALVRGANTPDALSDFGRWQDSTWRRKTLALR
jgi:hypothetical protein